MNAILTLAAMALAPLAVTTVDGSSTEPAPADDIVIEFTTGGGFSGPCCSFWDVPEITVYADGRAVIVESRAKPVADMRTATLAVADAEELLADAEAAGLIGAGAPDTGAICCDHAYTRVVLSDGESTSEFEVMGLGFEDAPSAELTDDQLELRTAVSALSDRVHELVDAADDTEPFVPAELALLVHEGRSRPDDEPQPWPLDRSLVESDSPDAQGDHCVNVTGADVATVLDAVGAAEGRSWTSDGADWTVFVRPLLPHESGCPESEERAAQRAELAERRAQWEAARVTDYTFVVAAHCFCPPDHAAPRTVTVTAGKAADVDPPLVAGQRLPLTVDELFDVLAQGLDGAAVVSASYDDDLGHPVSISIDWDQMTMDEESAYEVSALEPLS